MTATPADRLDRALAALEGLSVGDGFGQRFFYPPNAHNLITARALPAPPWHYTDDTEMAQLLAPLNHEPTALAVAAERAFLAKLEGSCRMPIAALGELTAGQDGTRFTFRGMILSADGKHCFRARRDGRPEEALRLAEDAAAEVIAAAGPELLRALRS